MKYLTSIPLANSSTVEIAIEVGQSIFLVGANGTGKSSLMYHFYNAHRESARRITAHRQTWFESNAISLSAQQKLQAEEWIKNSDTQPQARWKDEHSSQRTSIAIYDLLDADSVRSRKIASAVDKNLIEEAKELSNLPSPLNSINDLLRLSNIPIEVSVHENQQILATRRGSQPYSIAELSDGERNALLITANVLTAPANTLLLIDEPDRHLHRSIIAPLLTSLFSQRHDCAFIVSTHDVTLPADNPLAKTILVRGCTYSEESIAWDIDLLKDAQGVDELIQKDILGSRRRILFVEGDHTSLDAPLYALIFPEVSVIPKKSCRDVIHAVTGLRSASSLVWISAFGLIDNDRRPISDLDRLRDQGIFALPVYSVESIYYDPRVQEQVVKRHSSIVGSNPDTLLCDAADAAIAALRPHASRLAERAVERSLRDTLEKNMPTRKEIAARKIISVNIDVGSEIDVELTAVNGFLDQRDLPSLIARYPVRETPALEEISRCLGFQGRSQYEAAVRKLLMDNEAALAMVRGLFGSLFDELAA